MKTAMSHAGAATAQQAARTGRSAAAAGAERRASDGECAGLCCGLAEAELSTASSPRRSLRSNERGDRGLRGGGLSALRRVCGGVAGSSASRESAEYDIQPREENNV